MPTSTPHPKAVPSAAALAAEVFTAAVGGDTGSQDDDTRSGVSSDSTTAAQPVQPIMTSASRTNAAPQFAEDERVAVSYGYGANDLNSQPFWVAGIDQQFSKARIARGVPYAKAKALQQVQGGAVVRIHPNDASEAEIARRCGVRPAEPSKVAAMLLASDLDAIAAQIKPEELELLARKLRDLAIQKGAIQP